jgi:hypothetical protein
MGNSDFFLYFSLASNEKSDHNIVSTSEARTFDLINYVSRRY